MFNFFCSGPSNSLFKNASFLGYAKSVAIVECSFLNNQSYYCLVCCSTDPSVPPASYVYNISTTSGTDETVSLGGLTSGQMYYCKAAATSTTSTQCSSSVVGGVTVFISFVTTPGEILIIKLCAIQYKYHHSKE